MVEATVALEIIGDGGIAAGFLLLYLLALRVARVFSRGILDRLFRIVALVLLFFSLREFVDVALLPVPPLEQVEIFLDVGVEAVFLLIIATGIIRVSRVVRALQLSGKAVATETTGDEAATSEIRVLAEILRAALAEIATIMGPSVVYGVAGRACRPILQKAGRAFDDSWKRRLLPSELIPAVDTPTDPIETTG